MKIGRNEKCSCGSGKKYKKCCLTLHERKPHETLAKFFSKEWIKAELGKVKLDGYKNMDPINLARIDMHPLIKAIVGTQIKLQKSKEAGKTPIALGKDELLQNLLHENLTILDPLLDVNDLQKRLINKKEFSKAEYEIAIAAGYARMEYNLNFIQRSPTKRTGEFYVTDKSNNTVLVECKKKDMTSPKERRISSWWEEFQHLVMKKLKSAKKSYGIVIFMPFDPEKKEIHQIVNEVKDMIDKNYEGEVTLLSKYKIKMEIIMSVKQYEKISHDADLSMRRTLYNKKTGVVSEYMKIDAYFPSDFIDEKVSSIISTLGDAYGQLEKNKPNIVYIDINVASMTPERSRAIMLKILPRIEEKLYRDYSKISAVVLTNLKLLYYSEIMGFHANEHVIYNKKARIKLPNEFQVYGDLVNGQSILNDIKILFEK